MSDDRTIFALSSGQVPSGIAIVRVSGSLAGTALKAIAGRLPPSRMATRATLRNAQQQPIDDALTLWFPGPSSATGEDVAEFHIHGGRAVVAALVRALGALDGLRPAEPGEFTRRAFENGKLDLVAAEALDDLIHADTEQQRRLALRQFGGLLGDRARDWRQRIIDASALIEAGIDFADESDVADGTMAAAREVIATLRTEIDAALADGHGERMRDGLVVAVAGLPNVGKSTLANLLARREVAIVSPYAGTTRDIIEVHLDLGGYPVTLVDTAGLRETVDPVEREGIRRAETRAAAADLVLWLTDAEDDAVPRHFEAARVWVVGTKADVQPLSASATMHRVSAHSGIGIDGLMAALMEFAASQLGYQSGMITRARHRSLMTDASAGLLEALIQNQPELAAEGLRRASHALGRLLGRIDVEDVLGSIFTRFCIGK